MHMKFFAQKPSGKYKRFGALSALFLSVTASLTLFAGGVSAASLNSFSSVLQNTPIFSSEPALEKVSVKINGVSPSFAYAPFILGDYTLIPLRAVMENLGCKVEWVEKTQSILITSAGKNITLVIDSDEMTVNGVKKKIPAKAILVGEVTYVPLRAVSESLDATVGWDEKTQTAGIYSREKTHSLTLGICTVTIGQTYDSFVALYGLPTYSVSAENGLLWHVYANPNAFLAIASDGGIICAYYTNTPGFSTSEGLQYGAAAPADGRQYEYVHTEHVNLHKYYDTIEKQLCAVYAAADGYYNLHDINTALAGGARMGLDILNAFRAANHLPALTWDDAAAACSLDHAAYMADIGELTHTGASGESAITRYQMYNPGFKWQAWGENICAGAKNIFTCMNGWRNSRQHRAIMLSDKKYAGIGMIYKPHGAYNYSAAMLLLK